MNGATADTPAHSEALLADAVAIVTGGAQGIGRAIVEALLAAGAAVAFLDVDAELGERTAAELGTGAAAQKLTFIPCDITVEAQVQAAVAEVFERRGAVDVLVNNAGVGAYFDAAEMSGDQWDSVFAVDLKGAWICAKHVLPAMRDAGSGSIVNIASIHARLTHRGMFPYAAAKSGVIGMTRSLALDEGPNGIRVNAVSPGYTRTQLIEEYFEHQADPDAAERAVLDVHPLGRIADPSDIADAVVFLASRKSAFITGTELAVDGGLSAKFAS